MATDYEGKLFPHWKECRNAIAFSCSDLYVPYAAVYIKSIQKNANKDQKYDIVILESEISQLNKLSLSKTIEGSTNISIRYYNVNLLFDKIDLYISYSYFSQHCYYRLAVGKIFSEYDKVLFTDVDLIFSNEFNVNDMFKIDMHGMPVAAVEEILWTKENRKNKIQLNYDVEDYILNKVKCSDKYFNTGVMLVDISKFNNIASFENLLKIGIENRFINQEQCVLNYVFDRKIYALHFYYNFEIYEGIFKSTQEVYIQYMCNINKAKIYHYLANKKVWFFPDLPKANIWWEYARQTPFYEEILSRMVEFKAGNSKSVKVDIDQLRNEVLQIHFPNINKNIDMHSKFLLILQNINFLRFKKLVYKIKKLFSFGERYEKYQYKYKTVKDLIKDAENFKKNLMNL